MRFSPLLRVHGPLATIKSGRGDLDLGRDKHVRPYYPYGGTLFLTCCTVAAWSKPIASHPENRPLDPATTKGSVSGRISSIGGASFSVDVKKNQEVATLMFLIDDDTKVDGKLSVGSIATVYCRTDDGNNIASHVVVERAMGLH
jgi:hypothetical protein